MTQVSRGLAVNAHPSSIYRTLIGLLDPCEILSLGNTLRGHLATSEGDDALRIAFERATQADASATTQDR